MSTEESEATTASSTPCCCPPCDSGRSYGALLLRLWLAVRAIQTGIEKYAGTKASDQVVAIDGSANTYGLSASTITKEYGWNHYHGVPDALFSKFANEPLMHLPGPLENALKNMYRACGGKFEGVKLALADSDQAAMEAWNKFLKEPVLLNVYDWVLGPALLVLGITLLLGIATRTSLFLLGLLYISLTWGLILIKQDDGVAWLGIHMILITMALALANHQRFVLLKKW